MFNEKLLSNAYNVRMLTADDIDEIYKLCCKNPLFYEYHPPFVTYDSILEDMSALPPNKTMDDKYYIGFFSDEGLVAIMDLIIGYPKDDIVLIGFFMTDKTIQEKSVEGRRKYMSCKAPCILAWGKEPKLNALKKQAYDCIISAGFETISVGCDNDIYSYSYIKPWSYNMQEKVIAELTEKWKARWEDTQYLAIKASPYGCLDKMSIL